MSQNGQAVEDVREESSSKKHRSPNYPVIPLGKAVERASQLFSDSKRYTQRIGAVHELWGYKPGSGAGNQAVAALKAFGLIEVTGMGDERQIKVSDRAYRIILNADDAKSLLKEAFLSPPLYSDIWQRFDEGLPQDSTIRQYLLFERGFNSAVVDEVIADFRASIDYAGIQHSDSLSPKKEEEESIKPPPARPPQHKPLKAPPNPMETQTNASDWKDFPYYLSNNQRAVLWIPSVISRKDYRLLKSQVENSLLVLEATSVAEEVDSSEQSEAD